MSRRIIAALLLLSLLSLGTALAENNMVYGMIDEDGHVVPPHAWREPPADLGAWEIQVWTLAGYVPAPALGDGEAYCVFAQDGTLLVMQDMNVPWLEGVFAEDSGTQWFDDDTAADPTLAVRLLGFLGAVNPGMENHIRRLRLSWQYAVDGGVYVQCDGIPEDPAGEWITFVVRIEPTFQLQYFSCISNG